jgi:hypothetical protein
MPVAKANLPCWRRPSSLDILQVRVRGIPQQEFWKSTTPHTYKTCTNGVLGRGPLGS